MNRILKILQGNRPYVKLLELQNLGKLEELCPELSALDEKVNGHKNNFIHTLGVLKNVCELNNDYKMKIVALFHDIGKPTTKRFINGEWTFHRHEEIGAEMTMEILKRWNVEDEELLNYVHRIIYFHGRTKMHRDITDSAIRRFSKEVGIDIVSDLIDFCKCDITTKFEDKRQRYQSALDVIRTRVFEVEKMDEEAKWRSPLTGEIIMRELNLKPCKLIGDIKKVYDPLFKEDKITLEEAIMQIKQQYK